VVEQVRAKVGATVGGASQASTTKPSNSASSSAFNDQPITDWSFGSLPDMLEIKRGGQTFFGYPALKDMGDHCIVEVFDEEASKIKNVQWLAQGTIYPDVIESAGGKTKKAHNIKSHHNVGGLPETLNLKLLEPLRELFKDEVRELGVALGLAKAMVYRHPFPGPGLGIRILGDITAEKVSMLQEVDYIWVNGLKEHGLYDEVWQAGSILLPVQSVGVMGDERTYENAVALRAVTSTDGMTADWCHLPYEFLARISNEIINKVKGINRVTYDISSKPPATIEWE